MKKKLTQYLLRIKGKGYYSTFKFIDQMIFECRPSDIKKSLIKQMIPKIICDYHTFFKSFIKVRNVLIKQTNISTNRKKFTLDIGFDCVCKKGKNCHFDNILATQCGGWGSFYENLEITFEKLTSQKILKVENIQQNIEQCLTHENEGIRNYVKKVIKKRAKHK